MAEEDEFYRVSLNCGLISFRGMQGQSLKETLMPAGRDGEMPEVGTAGKVRQGKLNWKPCQSGEEEEEGAERKGKEGKEKREVAATKGGKVVKTANSQQQPVTSNQLSCVCVLVNEVAM